MQQNFKLLAWATLANGTCFSMILPLLAPLIRELGLTEVQGGVIVSAGAICMAIASILIARGEKIQTPYQLMNYGFWGMTITWAIFTAILYWGIQQTLPVMIVFALLVIIVRTSKNQYNTDMSYPIHFRKKILAKLEEGQSIRAVAQHFEIDKNTIVEWKKRIEIKRTRPRKPSKVDDDALRADVEQYPDDYQYERAARFGCCTSTIGDALKRLNITVKKRPYGTRKQKQNSENSI